MNKLGYSVFGDINPQIQEKWMLLAIRNAKKEWESSKRFYDMFCLDKREKSDHLMLKSYLPYGNPYAGVNPFDELGPRPLYGRGFSKKKRPPCWRYA